MTGERTLPGLGLTGYWDEGSAGWKPGMDANLRLLSVLGAGYVLSQVAAEPGSPSDGNIHLLTATANANKIVIRDDGAWVYVDPYEGLLLFDRDTDALLLYDGTAWGTFSGGGSAIAVQKDDVGVVAGLVTLNFEGDGVDTVVDEGSNKATVTISGGGGGGGGGGATETVLQRTLLGEYDLSVNTLDSGNEIDLDVSGYDMLDIEVDDATANISTAVVFRVGVTTVDSGASDYESWLIQDDFKQTAQAQDHMRVTGDGTANLNGVAKVMSLNDDSTRTRSENFGGGSGTAYYSMQYRDAAQADDTLQISCRSSAVMSGGTLRVYGYKSVEVAGAAAELASIAEFEITTSDSITESVETTIPWDVTSTSQPWASLDGGGSGEVTVSEAGIYLVNGYVALGGGDSNDVNSVLAVKVNGVQAGTTVTNYDTESWSTIFNGSIAVACEAGDTIELTALYFGSVSSTLIITPAQTHMQIVKLASVVPPNVVEETGTSYTITDDDLSGNKILFLNNAGAIDLTVNTGLTGLGILKIVQRGAGVITVGGTATINSLGGNLDSAGQHAVMELIPEGSDEYTLCGDIA